MTGILLAVFALAGMAALVVFYFKPYDYGAGSDAGRPAGKAVDDEDETVGKLVRVCAGRDACKHAAKMENRVFASRDAPYLPLADCEQRDCHCYYLFTEDRRSGSDRRAGLEQLDDWLADEPDDRRRSPGRRAGDLAPA